GRRLSGAEPEQSGSAQLPAQDEQPPRVAAARRRIGRGQPDGERRADLRRSEKGAAGGDGSPQESGDDLSAAVQHRRDTAGIRADQREVNTTVNETSATLTRIWGEAAAWCELGDRHDRLRTPRLKPTLPDWPMAGELETAVQTLVTLRQTLVSGRSARDLRGRLVICEINKSISR